MNFALQKILTIGVVLGFVYLFTFGIPDDWVGEVVELETYGPRGSAQRTSLWIVDGNGEQWLRASGGESTWVERLRVNPEVHVTRDGQRKPFRAEVATALLPHVNVWMQDKYGGADMLISSVQDPEQAIAIRLIDLTRQGSFGNAYR
jgi:hypothetical protein